ncbi:hypothetical protein GXW77_08960 [Roseomonas alkaliterrae]|nr:hypothetical protein [Neoroseomonas alkaliterrae]MBR0676300.1 hypothetical protein [Neoroseomonas alkaliterrae]
MAVAAHPSGAAMAMAGRYLALLLVANLAWEIAQLPLYTLWWEGSPGEIAWAVLHCTVGDGMIGAVSLGGAWLLTGAWGWPERGFGRVAIAATIFGVGATFVLEWLNVEIWRNWSYAAAMPRLPPLGTGLTPVLQWLLLPPICLLAARHVAPTR